MKINIGIKKYVKFSLYPRRRYPETYGEDILGKIGNTPLIQIKSMTSKFPDVKIFAKAEFLNPGGSVKDRPALNIVSEAERSGHLTREKTILDATSGNFGIALSMIGAIKGYRVKLVMPKNVSPPRRRVISAYGAELELTDPLEAIDGAIRRARELYSESPESYFYADQYSNEANWRAHYVGTGKEMLDQTGGKITHFVAGVGTSGTLIGAGKRLKEHSSRIKVIEVQPDSGFHGIEGLKHMESALVPSIYDPNFADERLMVGTEEAQTMCRRLARKEGLLVGVSSGAAALASLNIAEEIEEGVIVTVFPDSGIRYLDEQFWEESLPD